MGQSWASGVAPLGCFGGVLGLSWRLLGSCWAPLGLFGCLLVLLVDLYGAVLGTLWLHLVGVGCSWLLLAAFGLVLGRSWLYRGLAIIWKGNGLAGSRVW